MKKYSGVLITIFGVLAVLGGVILLSRSSAGVVATAAPSGDMALLTVSEKSFDFGSVSMAKGKVSHVFTLKNTGDKPFPVSKIYTSCMCTVASIETREGKSGPFGMPGHAFVPSISATIGPGEEAKVEAVFDPAAHGPAGVGRIERVVYVASGDAKPLELGFSAVVTP